MKINKMLCGCKQKTKQKTKTPTTKFEINSHDFVSLSFLLLHISSGGRGSRMQIFLHILLSLLFAMTNIFRACFRCFR